MKHNQHNGDRNLMAAGKLKAPGTFHLLERVNSMFNSGMYISENKLIRYEGAAVDVVVPDGVKIIGVGAFENSKIETVFLPDSVITIEDRAFKDCENLREIRLSKKLIDIGEHAFSWCKALKSVDLPETLSSLAHSSFGRTGLEKIVIPGSLRIIAGGAFVNTNLKTIVVSEGCKVIEHYAFSYGDEVENREIHLPASIIRIDSSAFHVYRGKNTIYSPVCPRIIAFCMVTPNMTWIPDHLSTTTVRAVLENFKKKNGAMDSDIDEYRKKIKRAKDSIFFYNQANKESEVRQQQIIEKINNASGLFKKTRIKQQKEMLAEEVRQCQNRMKFAKEQEDYLAILNNELHKAEHLLENLSHEDYSTSFQQLMEEAQPQIDAYVKEYLEERKEAERYNGVSVELTPDVIERINAAASAAVGGPSPETLPDFVVVPRIDVSDM